MSKHQEASWHQDCLHQASIGLTYRCWRGSAPTTLACWHGVGIRTDKLHLMRSEAKVELHLLVDVHDNANQLFDIISLWKHLLERLHKRVWWCSPLVRQYVPLWRNSPEWLVCQHDIRYLFNSVPLWSHQRDLYANIQSANMPTKVSTCVPTLGKNSFWGSSYLSKHVLLPSTIFRLTGATIPRYTLSFLRLAKAKTTILALIEDINCPTPYGYHLALRTMAWQAFNTHQTWLNCHFIPLEFAKWCQLFPNRIYKQPNP